MSRLPLTILSAVAAAAFAVPATAGAHSTSRDRDGDHMSNRWEKANGLKVSRNDARGDRDHDGLKNLAEFKAGLDPRDKDTDDDGIKDGAEHAGTVVTFTADAKNPLGVLVINAFGGQTLTGRVTADTEIECEVAEPAKLRSGGDDSGADESGDDDAPATGTAGTAGPSHDAADDNDQADDEDMDDDGDKDDEGVEEMECGPEALVAGAHVQEAKLVLTSAGLVFDEIQLGLTK